MAQIQVIFDSAIVGSGITATKDDWFDLSGVIPANTQLWLGYGTMISWDKPLTFEVRVNLPGKTAGTVADTVLKAFTSVPTTESRDTDMYLGGAIATLAPAGVPSTGVERVWLRVRSGSVATAAFDYIIYATTI